MSLFCIIWVSVKTNNYGPTFAKGGHKERAVYDVRDWRFTPAKISFQW